MQVRIQLAVLAFLIVIAALMMAERDAREARATEAPAPSEPGAAKPGAPAPGMELRIAFDEFHRDARELRTIPAPEGVTPGPDLPEVDPGRYAMVWTPRADGRFPLADVTVIARPPEHLVGRIERLRFWHHWLAGSGPIRSDMTPLGDGRWTGRAAAYESGGPGGLRPLVEICLKDGTSRDITGAGQAPTVALRGDFLDHYPWTFRQR